MKRPDTILIVQSSATGRFMASKESGEWTWAVTGQDMINRGSLMMALGVCEGLMNETHDDWVLDYVGKMRGINVFHMWVGDEVINSPMVDWFALFEFPHDFNTLIPGLLNDEVLMSRFLDPPR